MFTSSFALEYTYQQFKFEESLPRFRGNKAGARNYLGQIESGFAETYRLLLAHRDELLSSTGPLAPFESVRIRLVFRDTQDYANLLFWTTAPDILKSGAAYDVALETLAGSAPVFSNGSSYDEVVEEEKKSLWQRDVPIAFAHSSGTGIFFPSGREFGPIIPMPMFEQMKRRIAEASEADLAWQQGLIRSLFEMAFTPGTATGRASAPGRPVDGPDWEARAVQRILICAEAIGEDLDRIAVRYGNTVEWLSFMRFAGADGRVYPIQMDPWSLNGAAGNALFLANLAAATGEKRYATLARQGLASAHAALRLVLGSKLRELAGVSGYAGSFGLVYALAASGVQLGDEELIQQACSLALEYTTEQLEQEQNPDFLTGVAGTIAILTYLWRLTADSRLLDRARALGRACARTAVGEFARNGWQVPFFKRPLLGMAHGSAGIAAAHIRLFQATGEEDFLRSALAGMQHERDHFQPEDRNWPNLQEEPGRISYMTGWCAGAPGIGLSRLICRAALPDDPGIAQEIEDAIATTRNNLGGRSHHLCCGESGRLSFLAAASRELNRPELRSEALTAALTMIDNVDRQNYWYLQEFCEKVTVTGILGGVPGIGLTLLALARPSASNVLSLN